MVHDGPSVAQEPLSVPGVLESLRVIRTYVAGVATVMGLDNRHTYGLQLAVDEIVTNIITHGYGPPGRTGSIVIRAIARDSTLMVIIEDTAEAYTPHLMAPETLALPPEAREEGGLGLFLAWNAVDSFRYECGEGGNCHILEVRRVDSV